MRTRPASARWRQVSPDGHPTGSWVGSEQQAYRDSTSARQLLVAIERRAVTSFDEDAVDEAVARLTSTAGLTADRWWVSQRFTATDAFHDTPLWAQTEQVKNRREYLRDKHGDPEALPPGWMAAVQTAGTTPGGVQK